MVSLKFSIILLSLLSLALITQAQDPTYIYHNCPNKTTYTRNSTYQANLNLVLSSLSSNATRNNINGFYNVSAGQADVLYGMFLCRGDVNNSVCQSCVNFATKDVLEKCPIEKAATIWYDECELRYSNRNFFSTVDQNFTLFMMSPYNVTVQPDRFDQLVANTLYMAARAASAGSGAKKFAVQQADYTLIQNLYTLVQCTPDLSSLDCRSCLDGVISKLGNCCNRKQGGRVIFASCNFRYEVYEFYNATAAVEAVPAPPPATPSPPPASGSKTSGKGKKSNTAIRIIVIIVVPTIGVMILVICICICLFIRTRKQSEKERAETMDEIESAESLQFAFSTIRDATHDFLEKNRLGQGGFGVVYKGVLPSGQEIAVKRLSKDSGQGDFEFKNEVLLVAKLQHRNLVRLLGFCLQGIERLLIYEFVPNASLDHFIFDPTKRVQLSWERRYKIIGGIARGLLYLHEDSRLRIIHRDLKASNILLDEEMNPKISDFGMARLFVVDQTQGNTSKIVGTYGYMAPEYALQGHFSVKLDVFSFGVLALEIVTGKKNSFRNGDDIEHLISHAWRNWREGTTQDIIDPVLSSGSATEMMRCIHIGLLCVQENIADRPTMASVVLMLSSSSLTLQVPSQPAFFMSNRTYQSDMSSSLGQNSRVTDQSSLFESEHIPLSRNEVSISELYPR